MGNVMLQRGMPLPPQLTGVPYPSSYDPSTSPWRTLDVSTSDIGVVRLAGKDVDLFKFWALINQAGGSAKVSSVSSVNWPSETATEANVAPCRRSTSRAYGDKYCHILIFPSSSFSQTDNLKRPQSHYAITTTVSSAPLRKHIVRTCSGNNNTERFKTELREECRYLEVVKEDLQ